jgi:hypothetical protein
MVAWTERPLEAEGRNKNALGHNLQIRTVLSRKQIRFAQGVPDFQNGRTQIDIRRICWSRVLVMVPKFLSIIRLTKFVIGTLTPTMLIVGRRTQP